jgi:hypothetical protein
MASLLNPSSTISACFKWKTSQMMITHKPPFCRIYQHPFTERWIPDGQQCCKKQEVYKTFISSIYINIWYRDIISLTQSGWPWFACMWCSFVMLWMNQWFIWQLLLYIQHFYRKLNTYIHQISDITTYCAVGGPFSL